MLAHNSALSSAAESLRRQPAQHAHVVLGEAPHLFGLSRERADDPGAHLDRGQDGASGLKETPDDVRNVVLSSDASI